MSVLSSRLDYSIVIQIGKVKQEQSKKIEDLTNALIESQKRITSLETMNQVLREKLLDLENGQKANTETLTAIVQKIAKEEVKQSL